MKTALLFPGQGSQSVGMLADIGPGVRVFESGVGSGALSMTMLRWGASIVGYEVREVSVAGALHLKTAVTQVSPDWILVNPAWVDATATGYELTELKPRRIAATEP